MALTFQKYITVSNPRLMCLYMLFCTLLAGFLCTKFLYYREFLEYYSVQNYVHVSTWEDATVSEGLAESTWDICHTRECIAMCGIAEAIDVRGEQAQEVFNSSNYSIGCVDPSHLAFSISNDDVFYVTRIQRSNISSGRLENFITPYEHFLNFSFHFSLAIPDRELGFPDRLWWESSSGWQETEYARDSDRILVGLMDHQGDLKSRLDFSDGSVELSLLDLMEVSGLDGGWLDQPVVGALWSPNETTLKDGQSETYLIGRETGVKLFLTVKCYDRDSHWHFSFSVFRAMNKRYGSRSGTRCEVSVGHSTEFRARRDVEGVDRHSMEHHYGIHVVARTGGYMSRTNVEYIYQSLVTAYVLSKLPKILTLFIAVFLLGHLSTIYKRNVYEVFDIAEQVAGTSARLMANTVSFEELCDHGEEAMTYTTMHRRIGEAIQKRTDILDDAEVNTLVRFCHKAVLDKHHFIKHERFVHEMVHDLVHEGSEALPSILGVDKSKEAPLAESPANSTARVDFGNFCAACSSNDKVPVIDVLKLFDRDRETSTLERWFMPRYVRKLVIDATGPRERGAGSPSPSPSESGQSQGTQELSRGLSSIRHPSASTIEISTPTAPSPAASEYRRKSNDLSHATVGHKAYARVLAVEKQAQDLADSAANNAANTQRAIADSQKAVEMQVQVMLSKALSGEPLVVAKATSADDEAPATPEARTITSVFIPRQEAHEVVANLQRELIEYVDQSIQQCMENLGQKLMADVMNSVRRILEERDAARVGLPSATADPAVTTALDATHRKGRDPSEPQLAQGLRNATLPVAVPPALGSVGDTRPYYFKKEVFFTKHFDESGATSRRSAPTDSSKRNGSSPDSSSAAPPALGEDAPEREPQTSEEARLGQALGRPASGGPLPGGTWVPWFKSTLGLASPPTLPLSSTQREPTAEEDDRPPAAYAMEGGRALQEAGHEHRSTSRAAGRPGRLFGGQA